MHVVSLLLEDYPHHLVVGQTVLNGLAYSACSVGQLESHRHLHWASALWPRTTLYHETVQVRLVPFFFTLVRLSHMTKPRRGMFNQSRQIGHVQKYDAFVIRFMRI